MKLGSYMQIAAIETFSNFSDGSVQFNNEIIHLAALSIACIVLGQFVFRQQLIFL